MSSDVLEKWTKHLPLAITLGSIIALVAVANAQLQDLKAAVNMLQQENVRTAEFRARGDQRYEDIMRILREVREELRDGKKNAKL